MTEQDESATDHVGTRWGNKCPQCDHVETRDYGPGRYPSADRCPKCNWPMNCVDLDAVDQEPKRELVTDGGDRQDGEVCQTGGGVGICRDCATVEGDR